MQEFGTVVAGGIAPGRGGERIHETIPVYDSVADTLAAHPNLAAVSIWRHLSSARDAALEAKDRVKLKRIRRKIHRLKRRIHKATV